MNVRYVEWKLLLQEIKLPLRYDEISQNNPLAYSKFINNRFEIY